MHTDATSNAGAEFKSAVWLVLLAVASVLAAFPLACATPFAALAALSAIHLRRSEAVVLTAIVWLASQIAGFGFLHYPHAAKTYAWSAALLFAALACLAGAEFAVARLRPAAPAARAAGALLAAMAVFKTTIFLFGVGLGGNEGAFAAPVLMRFAITNSVVFATLCSLHRFGRTAGLANRGSRSAALLAR